MDPDSVIDEEEEKNHGRAVVLLLHARDEWRASMKAPPHAWPQSATRNLQT